MSDPELRIEFTSEKNGQKFVIQQANSNYTDEIINSMIKYFLREEPTCKYLKVSEDNDFINELKIIWRNCLEKKLSLICVTQQNVPKLAGFLLLCKTTKNEEECCIPNKNWRKISNIIGYISQKSDVFNKLQIQEYLTDLGLLVLPNYRGLKIAEKLLDTSEIVCNNNKLKAVCISFTSTASQTLAKKLGWEELFSISYLKLKQMDESKFGIEGIEEHTKEIKYMYKFKKN